MALTFPFFFVFLSPSLSLCWTEFVLSHSLANSISLLLMQHKASVGEPRNETLCDFRVQCESMYQEKREEKDWALRRSEKRTCSFLPSRNELHGRSEENKWNGMKEWRIGSNVGRENWSWGEDDETTERIRLNPNEWKASTQFNDVIKHVQRRRMESLFCRGF